MKKEKKKLGFNKFIINFIYCFTGIGLIIFHSIILIQLITSGCTFINPSAPLLYLFLFCFCYAIKQGWKKNGL